MIKAIAIDDEIPALSVIENFSARPGFIQLLKTFNKPSEAMAYLADNTINLIFLDINMPSVLGIDFYKSISQKAMVIFTTAYSQYAVEGFNLNAVDYLLKPFTYDRFLQAVQKAKDSLEYSQHKQSAGTQYIFIRADYSQVKINLTDILFIESLDDYLKIRLQNQKPLVARITMKSILKLLPPENFIRVHRSYIISLRHVQNIRNKTVTIAGEAIPVGSSYEENLLKCFNT